MRMIHMKMKNNKINKNEIEDFNIPERSEVYKWLRRRYRIKHLYNCLKSFIKIIITVFILIIMSVIALRWWFDSDFPKRQYCESIIDFANEYEIEIGENNTKICDTVEIYQINNKKYYGAI